MKDSSRHFRVQSLDVLTSVEAAEYLDEVGGDEIAAAMNLAVDRNILAHIDTEPDSAEIHHALYLLRRAVGQSPPSYDSMRVELRRRMAA
ncbi:MAG: hypothetical protein KBF88_11100 [Polyangiaceae bacterium]|nr:hypothetical protein [Polyangiaceae bacterium]